MNVPELEKLMKEGKTVVAAVLDGGDLGLFIKGPGNEVSNVAGVLIGHISAGSGRPMTMLTTIMETAVDVMKMVAEKKNGAQEVAQEEKPEE